MLSGTHFYHATIKRIVSVFGTLFNNITIGRHGSGNTITNIQKVPISYGPRQKFISRMNKDLDGNKIAIKLPRMSFEITSIEYDTSTKLNRLNTTLTSGSNNSPRTRNKMYQSVPYTIGMQLNILARNQEDALQILEQIIPTFSPEYTVTIKDIEGPGSKTDVPFILNGVSFDDTYEGDYQGRRTLTYTLDFTIRARFAPNTSNVKIIRKVETEVADFTNVATSAAQTLSMITTRSDSPNDTIKTFVSLINPEDTHTVDLVYRDISVSGIPPLNKITGISINSGATADFDRVEDEDFSSTLTNLSGTPSLSATANVNGATTESTSLVIDGNVGTLVAGMVVTGTGVPSGLTITTVTDQNNIVLSDEVSFADDLALTFLGTGATFSVNIDGQTGATTSVSLLNKGQGYQATETITISSDHYSNTNLVLTINSVADGTGDDPLGAVLTFSVTSGNGANTDFTNSFAPTFTRTGLATEPVLNSPLDSPANHGSGATVDLVLNKAGLITSATLNQGGADYSTSDQIKVLGTLIGETEKEFSLENLPVTGGTGSGAEFSATLISETGALTNVGVSLGGSGYTIGDALTIAASNLGENSPAGDALDTNLVLSVTGINNSPNDPNAGDTTGVITSTSITSGATGDLKRVGALKYSYDSPFTDLVLDIDSVDSTSLEGTYTKIAGKYNNKPRYAHNTESGVEIRYNGSDWVLRQGTDDLANASVPVAITPADSPVLNVPLTDWIVFGRDDANMVVSTTENLDFSLGEEIVGNISLGTANVLSANNNKVQVNSLEALYVVDEVVTGTNSGISRTVFSTRRT